MFSNGIPHQKQKAFLVQICKIAQRSKIGDTSLKLIKEYSRNWEKAGKYTKVRTEKKKQRQCKRFAWVTWRQPSLLALCLAVWLSCFPTYKLAY